MPLSREVGILSENEISKSERSAKEHYMKELSEEKLKVIRAFSSKFLVFFSVFLPSSKNAIGLL
jgi:ribosomal RNA-processing protein 12